MRNRIMILCTFCAIAIFSFAQEKFSIRGIANEELNNQLLYLCLMGDGEKAKEVVLDSTTVEKGKFSFSGVHQMPDIAIIKDMDGETYPLIFEKGEISVNIAANKRGGTPLNDSLNIALNRMQLIMDNMLKTSDSIYKLMTGMKSEEFADKMVNDTVFRARYDKIEKNFLAQMDSVSHCIKDYKNSIVGVYLFSVGGMMMPFDDMKILMKEASPMFSQNNLVRNIVEKKNQAELRMKAELENKMTPEQRVDPAVRFHQIAYRDFRYRYSGCLVSIGDFKPVTGFITVVFIIFRCRRHADLLLIHPGRYLYTAHKTIRRRPDRTAENKAITSVVVRGCPPESRSGSPVQPLFSILI